MNILVKTAGEVLRKTGDMRETMLHNIWLAGLGAYAKSTEEVNQLGKRSVGLFEELVEQGRQVEQNTTEKLHVAKSQTAVALEERVHKLVQGVTGIDTHKLDVLDEKLEKVSEQLAELAKAQAAQPAAEAPKAAPKRRRAAAKPAEKAAPVAKDAEK